jgi:hypothetical protein
MPNDNRDADGGRENVSDHKGLSQDALRHEKDAQHHKFHKGPQPSTADEKNGQQSQARAQQDSVEVQHSEAQQPEIPKVGSRDALGG